MAKRTASCERQLQIRVYKRVPDRHRTASQILTGHQLDLHPDPSVNKKLKLSLVCKKKGKGRADPENSERFTFIDDAKFVSLENKLLQRTWIAI